MKRKIATSVMVRINVGNFQHVEISKYAEGEIEFENSEERVKLENELHNDILDDIIRNMRVLPEKLGKTTDAIPVFEESIQKKVPEWMQTNIEPNIAKQSFDKKQAEVKSKAIDEEKEMDALLDKPSEKISEIAETEIVEEPTEEKSVEVKEETEVKAEEPTEEKPVEQKTETDDFLSFEDEDLFE